MDLVARLAVAEEAARLAGQELLSRQGRVSPREKGRFDLVTEADLASQQMIQEKLLAGFPGDGFLGEESGRARASAGDTPLWVVDPLDGTTNYVHGLPTYAVSIGLVLDGRAVGGVIYDPNRDELFCALRGVGAWLNGETVRASQTGSLGESLISVGFPADWRGQDKILEVWGWFGGETQGLRRTGSSALNLAYVAAGRMDGFFAFQICPWDVAAGIILVEEAGGRITNRAGNAYDVLSGELLVASNGPLHGELLRGLRTLD